ncbi:ABC transporter ATP-binding protein [Pimelobacter sp. 30-1]|uniref:ABC transporter ATP-binding protein n=1 Tax=Pimelobacter sp. 30-1 TaxID=2004991 RepID=UPI001C05702E|nr:ABC transporter ATP-binding protein [Pimelobacter sp. 30-1]MBU2694978.1 hypothetical protein [Pimelobacter sp. 30-1]
MLDVSGVEVRFGGVRALDGLTITVGEGEVVSLIGPNGAGKSTAFNVITRIVRPQAGAVRFRGRDVLALPAHAVPGLGIGRTYQGLELFASMTVGETLMVGHHAVDRCGLVAAALRVRRGAGVDRAARTSAREIAERLSMTELWDVPVTTLPYGVQKRVDIGRALVGRPALLLLDEPAAGLTHHELDGLGAFILGLRADLAMSVLLVEHHMPLVMAISDRINVLDSGRPLATGTPAQIREDARVIEAYLGVPAGGGRA